jgi:tripartite-type tricarboxylate transporter receptor subunit TctC
MISKRAFLHSAAGMALASFGAGTMISAKADTYPSHPVRWIVPYTAGGATDVISRLICQRLSERLGQPFVVENKPGAGSNIGTQAVIASPPDGYTLLLTSTANAINASFDPSLPFDFAKGIVPVAGVARIPLVLVVNNGLPVHNIAEFIAYAKANPGKLSIASSGIGTSLHLSGELFKSMAGIAFTHVPYRGAALAFPDIISNKVQLIFDNLPTAMEQARGGSLRALGVASPQRWPGVPDIPAIAETVPGFEAVGFYGILRAKGHAAGDRGDPQQGGGRGAERSKTGGAADRAWRHPEADDAGRVRQADWRRDGEMAQGGGVCRGIGGLKYCPSIAGSPATL